MVKKMIITTKIIFCTVGCLITCVEKNKVTIFFYLVEKIFSVEILWKYED